MQTIIETEAYLVAVRQLKIDDGEQADIIDLIASNPAVGEVMPGCGGARNVRIRRPGAGSRVATD